MFHHRRPRVFTRQPPCWDRPRPIWASLLVAFACGSDPWEAGNLVAGTVDEDPSLPAFDVAGSRLHLETMGDPANPTLVFLHGGPGTGDYRSLLRLEEPVDGRSLAEDYHLVFYDQRGAGLSRRHGDLKGALDYAVGGLELRDYLGDLEEIVEAFSPDRPVHLFGHSWGGMHAVQYVNAHPERVAGLVLSEPGSLSAEIENSLDLEFTTVQFADPALNDFMWEQQGLSAHDHASLDYLFMVGFLNLGGIDAYHFSETDPLPLFRFGVVASLNDLGQDGMNAEGTYTFDFTDNLDSFRGKTLFINGDQNEILSVDFQRKHNMPLFSDVRLEVIEGAGHDLMWTHAEDHVRLIRTHLEGIVLAEAQ